MNPTEEALLWQEINRLRERLESTSERHAVEIDSIRRSIISLEDKLGIFARQEVDLTGMQRAKLAASEAAPVKGPPPLPKPREVLVKAQEPPPPPKPPEPIQKSEVENPSPAPSIPAPPLPDSSFELDFGKVWFVRIGVVILLTGLVFLGNYAYQNWIREMPNGVRLAALFACAGALIETGRRLAAKENLSRFGEVLLAGGMAFFYYCTFAAHHVGRLKVIDSPVFAAVLLFGAAGAIAAVSWLRQAKVTAALGFVLAAYATMLQPIGWMSCVSNVLLGAMGLFFMLKPGWSGPGWASMLGSYCAFFGWQLLGASGGEIRIDEPAVLWFLPPLWVMFSVPGVAGQFRESLSDRARAWFTAANNALFFLLFSAIWLQQNGDSEYWKVAAVFGPILIILGIIGRRQDTTAGGVNISQGLAVATFALMLKLEGHHLALTLAAESLALAIAAWKYRGKSEAVFSLVAGIAAAYLVGKNVVAFPPVERIPIWSASLVAIFISAASVVTARIRARGEGFSPFLRFSSVLLFLLPTLIVTGLCLQRLGHASALLTAVLLSSGLSLASLKLDKSRRQPEICWALLWFLGLGLWLGFDGEKIWPLGLAAAVSLAACWLWHHVSEEDEFNIDLALCPMIPAWAFSAAVPLFLWQLFTAPSETYYHVFLSNQLSSLALVPAAIFLGCKRLTLTAAIAGMGALGLIVHPGVADVWQIFAATILGLIAAAILHANWLKTHPNEACRTLSPGIFRATAFIAYCLAWHQQSPEGWLDWLALTAILLIVFSVLAKRKLFVESIGLIAIALFAFFFITLTSAWRLSPDETSWRGFLVVVALIVLVFTSRHRPVFITDQAKRQDVIRLLAGLACLVATLWATQMLVWRFGWKPTAVLWTLLGFVYVSTGLWQRLHIVRVSGFILLVLSLGKLFVADVWDFTAFMRVVSFIVLGAALILLGLFYNKFAHAIKALLDDEKGMGKNEAPPGGSS